MSILGNRYIRFNVNLLPGPITDPTSGEHPFIDIEKYVASARLAESALFDSIFLADAVSIAGDPAAGFSWALDPFTILAALARETSHIGLIASASTTYSHPYSLARAVLSVDHISKGRAGWNMVTTMDPAAAANFGAADHPSRAARYQRAQEFAATVIALWQSWKVDWDGGWSLDSHPYKPIDHKGEHFTIRGPLQLPSSRQGLPVIFQAGGSDEGLDFAAAFAEGVFVVGVEKSGTANYRSRLNAKAQELRGRSVSVLPGLGVTVGSTEEEVARLIDNAENAIDAKRVARVAKRYNFDPEKIDPDDLVPAELLSYGENTISKGFAQGGVDLAKAGPITWRRFLILGGGGHRRVFGTPESIADDLIDWVAVGAADGFNLSAPDLVPFIDHVVPELQARGVYRRAYTGRTLRDNLSQHG